ncbi:hypothetical protein Klosneuvirus_2_187 [Klosneuvirus KNV1]|uniref:Uncharacterized protein n=1 Tax=Klosneuvirus KNV1 TaxID=1977640 RepID=A0A1V0SJB2_9VIRU|nr:hypothetical protein Klosneuvirus_2_187 [Klosneuvirus KNV1]
MESIGFLQAFANSNELIYPKVNTSTTTQYISIGNLFEINNRVYVLSCNHCIKHTMKQNFIINDKNFQCTLKFFSDELELALLEIHNLNTKYTLLTIADLEMEVNTKVKNVLINTLDIEDYLEHKPAKQITIECSKYRTEYKKLESLNMPELPVITMEINNDIKIDMHGISGSLVYYDNKIIGIVSKNIDNKLSVIPGRNIYRFLTEIIKTNEFNGLCTIIGDISIVNFETDEGKSVNGLQVDDTLNINYNDFEYKEKNTKCLNLKTNDVIFKIDSKNITDNGYIFDDKLQSYIDYRTFISLNYICGDEISLRIMRCTDIKNNDYKEKSIVLRARPLNSLKYIPLISKNNIFEYHGLVFGEISENIINDYIDVGIHLGYSLKDYYINKPYRNDQIQIVVLLDIDKNIHKYLIDKINLNGLPLLHIKDKEYGIPIIKKINKHKITSLEKMKNILSKQPKNIIYLDIDDIKKIKIQIENNQIIDIQ